jgi:anti-anti-sigma factor
MPRDTLGKTADLAPSPGSDRRRLTVLRKVADITGQLLILPLGENSRGYSLVGELDFSNAHKLAEVLREECRQSGDVILDISRLRFIDSSGLHVVLDACDQLRDGRLIMRNPSPPVDRVFEVSGIERVEGIRIQKGAN